MINVEETKHRILGFLNEKGPSLPREVASFIKLDNMWASAILSELTNEKRVKLSSLKIGSSPLYLLPGQEEQLIKFEDNITGMSKEAYLLLKNKKILKDEEQSPELRVALRGLKDFAVPITIHEELHWKFFTASNEELQNKMRPSQPKQESDSKSQTPPQNKEPTQEEAPKQNQSHSTKQDDEESMHSKILKYLDKNNIKLLEETDVKKKEFLGIGRTDSSLGEIEILIIGKDKKTITEKDLEKIFELIKTQKRFAILFTTGELAKKSKEVYRDYKNLIILIEGI
jgi:hypothetical protein